ncbi:MAG: HAMP domain-containing protein [Xenococcaceae cyanobacterium MO_188.B32]|nr:HAMP domain-containing protein [Xenococcaceae cyanobacterium MO_188.B32]
MVIAVRDARADYQTGTKTIILVIKVATAVSILFFAIAWVTAGRVLLPLRQVTKTARTITQTDMSRRITVTGNDEIAELSATRNRAFSAGIYFSRNSSASSDAGHEPTAATRSHLGIRLRPRI